MKIDYISLLLKISLILLSILLIAIFIVEIQLSVEFLLIIGLIFILPLILIIMKLIFDMKHKEKENESLDKLSDAYIKNKNTILKKFKIIIILSILFEIIFFIFNYIFLICMCGHHEFKTLPMLIYIILQIIFNVFYFIKLKNKEFTVKSLIDYFIMSFVLFLIIVVLSKNDMDKLHNIGI